MSVYQPFRSVRAGLGASYRLAKNARYVYCNFRAATTFGDGLGGAVASTDAAMSYAQVGDVTFQVRNEQANATAVMQLTADGLFFINDAGDNDGIGVSLGRTITSSDTTENANEIGAFIVGTDEFFLRVKLDIVDVSDCDQMVVGFAKGAWHASGDNENETDFAGFNVDVGDVKIETILNNAGTSVTDTTSNFADNGQHTFEVRVNRAGLCKFLYDGEAPVVDVTGFSFDSGDVVHAIVSELNVTTDDPEFTIMEWESGLLSSRGLADITDILEDTQL